MASKCLFDMELDNKELEIDDPFIFEKIEEELKECLLEQQVGGDSTEFFTYQTI